MSLGKLVGADGCSFLEVTTAHTSKRFYALVINTDAVFTTLTATSLDGDATTINLLTANGFASATVKQGMFVSAPAGHIITALTLSSGTAIGYDYPS